MSSIPLTSSHHRWQLAGPDAARYLNGQISNDVHRCTETTGIAACVCNAKGKLDGIVHVSPGSEPDHFIVDFPAELEDTLPLRLERYLIADDAEWSDLTDSTFQIHITDTTADIIAPLVASLDGVVAISQARFGALGVDVIGPIAQQSAAADALAPIATITLDAQELEDLRIANGAPRWGAELTPDTLPKEVGLEPTHVSFTKGCYIGQETISRMKTAGKVRQALCKLTTSDPVTTGMELIVEGSDKPCGTITSVDSAGTTALALVKRAALESPDAIALATNCAKISSLTSLV
ncbi:YgfZ/GcvT domain-containing protein [Sulfuriroseicoccus oceanibius]|uniref:Uncharacterized protein n=1 Tax=Sulfuriroseicoccus oceanibius TaxID=2707525 RepID=A0A6B3LD40_9BACT|nr:hypothetical protein [Sulfuriroseicoccus oceanibius]QQL43939.1 hypothetical protein G3M56_008520 [Sulfuriroseicoccus oceanibius]